MREFVEIVKPRYAKILWNDKYVVDYNGKIYDIKDETSIPNVVYSLPNNDKYDAWTPKILSKIPNENIWEYWGKFKPKQRIKGYVFKDKFVIMNE